MNPLRCLFRGCAPPWYPIATQSWRAPVARPQIPAPTSARTLVIAYLLHTMTYVETAAAPVNACYLVKCGTCGKTTWKVRPVWFVRSHLSYAPLPLPTLPYSGCTIPRTSNAAPLLPHHPEPYVLQCHLALLHHCFPERYFRVANLNAISCFRLSAADFAQVQRGGMFFCFPEFPFE